MISARCRYGAERTVAAGTFNACGWPASGSTAAAAAPLTTPDAVREIPPQFPTHTRPKHNPFLGAKMVKQKNHTARNKTVKEHANGIKRVPNFRYKALKHMDAKFYRNLKYSKKWQKGGRPKDESDDEEEEEE